VTQNHDFVTQEGKVIKMSHAPQGDFRRSAPYWLLRLGVQSWLFIGMVLAFGIFSALYAVLNDILIPLIVSILLAILFRPVVDWLERRKVSRSLGTVLTMILIFLGILGLIAIVIKGIVQQGPEIAIQLQAGWTNLRIWLSEYEIQLPSKTEISAALEDALPMIFEGLFGFLGSTLASAISLFVGIYFGAFILFFLLRDAEKIQAWASKGIRIKPKVGANIISDASQTVLVYFRGTALTALITSVVVAIPLILLNVPLVGSIWIIYFFTSFIPYLGAWIAGAFAVLIALGAGGIETALIVLVAVIISNGVLQSVISSWALGSMLEIYPLVIFLVTVVAGMIGGILLMILAVPLTAIVIQIVDRLGQEGVYLEDEPSAICKN
jgi:predicted PurR-regulated permease PerM